MFVPFSEMPLGARVWVYQADRFLSDAEEQLASAEMSAFVERWTAHQKPLKASATVLHQLFLVLAVDEQMEGASGCSIDASVHALQALAAKLSVDLFQRLRPVWKQTTGQPEHGTVKELAEKVNAGLQPHELFIANLQVCTVGELQTQFWLPYAASWVAGRLPIPA